MTVSDHTGRPDPLSAGVTCETCQKLMDVHEYRWPNLAPSEKQLWRDLFDDILDGVDSAPVVLMVEGRGRQRVGVSPMIGDGVVFEDDK